MYRYIVSLDSVNLTDKKMVGGKNASLGEMIQHLTKKGITIPKGFAITTTLYAKFIKQHHLDKAISHLLSDLDMTNINQLEATSKKIKKLIIHSALPQDFIKELKEAYATLDHPVVAVRSSAVAEDSESASFAGQQDTFLNVTKLKNIEKAIKMVFASIFNSRSIVYRDDKKIKLTQMAISVGVQEMVRSDKGTSGVLFTLDTESGFDRVMLINASYGLGEAIVQGKVDPDEYCLSKPLLRSHHLAILQKRLGKKQIKMIYARHSHLSKSIKIMSVPAKKRMQFCLTDEEIETLAKQALIIEEHYGKPMDIEWAKDGISGKIYVVQARHETIKSKEKNKKTLVHYALSKKSKLIVEGQSIGQQIGSGSAHIILSPKKMNEFKDGEVLVTTMTDPAWEPIMKRAAAIITDKGGRTCHAAIIARELGIPALVGCGEATKRIKNKTAVTVSCAEGQNGFVYEGILPVEVKKIPINNIPDLPIKLCLNLGNPDKAFISQFLPNHGVGLARLEFIISNMIGIHPNAILHFDKLPTHIQRKIKNKVSAYKSPVEFYIEKLREGISLISAAFYPKQVIFRFSDFKSNEYANLIGGELYEPQEENPMIGYRGAARYKHPHFSESFELECIAFKRVREKMYLTNTQLMVPFVRTVDELREIMELIASYGLKRGDNGLKIYMMCEVPSNVLLAEEFLQYVDGFSIGSNDLTQLTLGLDRDSSIISNLFDERNEAMKIFFRQAIQACLKQNKYIGICGEAPSNYPEFAKWLVQEGIQHISLNPNSILETWLMLANELAYK